MPTAEQVLDVARRELGTRETPVNRQKYGAAYGSNGVAWCLIFCWWVMQQASGTALLPRSAYTPFAIDWFRTRAALGSAPRPGAVVFFNWRTRNSRPWPQPEHVGFVEAVHTDGSITTIEGNTQSGGAGNQSDGGGVYRRRRATTNVVGYGYPAYSAAAPAATPREGFLMALNDQQQADLLGMVNAIYAQMSGDEDGPGPDGWGWPSKRFDGGPDLTIVDSLREVDREVNSRIGLDGRPGPDEDKLLGHVVSLRAELRALRSDVTTRLAKLAQTGGLPTVVAGADPDTFAAIAKAVADEQDRRQRERLAQRPA
jgi:hypothetical protein